MIDKKIKLPNSITFYMDSNGNLPKEMTIFKDRRGNIRHTFDYDFSSIDAVELLKIGVFGNEKTIRFFKGKKVCRLPKKVKDISHFFYGNENEKIEGLEKWDVSNVEYRVSTFENCKNFNQDLSHWNVKNVFNVLGPLLGPFGYVFDTFNLKNELKLKIEKEKKNDR